VHSNCCLTYVIESKIVGKIEVGGRRGRIRKQILDYIKEAGGYWKMKEEALDHTVWRTRFGRGSGPVVRQTTE
jgi:hypothetical protein